ncbi:MAG: hypothetical protein ACUZ8I_06750 [Candidatus Scalindua sp.]
MKQKIQIPSWVLCAIIAFMALGWFTVSYLFGKLSDNDLTGMISAFSFEIFKIVFVGSSAGLVFSWLLKHIFADPIDVIPSGIGIRKFYKQRADAEDDFRSAINDEKVKNIFIVGISLRDFLTGAGKLVATWQDICDRLEKEQSQNMNPKERLKVKVLLYDQMSGGGLFRHSIEKPTIGNAGLPIDVPQGVNEVTSRQQQIYQDKNQEFLQVRIYEHSPFSFVFATDKDIFMEPYSFRDHRRKSSLPLIRFHTESTQYREVMHSIYKIWDHASIETTFRNRIGTANAITKARIKNIFRREDRDILAGRLMDCIESTEDGETVNILSISGKFFTVNRKNDFFERIRKIKVKFAVLNPVSQQAILRAIADSSPSGGIRDAMCKWTWGKHQESQLYTDVRNTYNEIAFRQSNGFAIELNFYTCAISCFLLLTPTSSFIEQYLYGRSIQFYDGLVLGGEYPVLEYDTHENIGEDRIEQEVLSSTFNVIWDSYSISHKDYIERTLPHEEEYFNMSLERVLKEFECRSSLDSN